MNMKKIDKETKKGIIIWFYVLSVPILVGIWFHMIFHCFALFNTYDSVCYRINDVKLNVFYSLAVIWLSAPIIINYFKRSLYFGITFVGLLLLGVILLSSAIYSKRLNDVSPHLFNDGMFLCDDYTEVYKKNKNKYSGIYECTENNEVFYLEIPNNTWEYLAYEPKDLVNRYYFGYTYDSTIDKYFHDFPYFYSYEGDNKGLRIALTAESEDDLIDKYATKLYFLIKKLTKDFDNDKKLFLTIYYNDSLDGINSTYDKFFLNAGIKYKNQSIFTKRQQYEVRHLKRAMNTFFSDNNFPVNARKALNNRHISVVIENPKTIGMVSFKNELKKSFVK